MSDYRKFISVVVFNRLQYNERCSVSAWDLHFEHVLRKTCPIDPSLGEIPSVYNEETIWPHTICIKRNMIIYGAVWPCYSICLLSMRLYGRTWTPYRFIWLILLLNFMKNMMQPKLEQLKEIGSIASPELSSILHILCLTELCILCLSPIAVHCSKPHLQLCLGLVQAASLTMNWTICGFQLNG